MSEPPRVPDEVLRHYEEEFDEAGRLTGSGWGLLEYLRTQELLRRFLPEPPARIIDIGGGPGTYAAWLTQSGYEVHLIDPVPTHIEQARRRPIFSVALGEARALDYPDDSFDAALLLGPLYHLTERPERLRALIEARRVVRSGPVVGAAISRFASAIDGLQTGAIDEPTFRRMLAGDLATGVHHNPTGDSRYFTTAFLHRPGDLRDEYAEAGLSAVEVFAVEGLAFAAPDLEDRMAEVEKRAELLALVKVLEREPAVLGATGHLLAVGWV